MNIETFDALELIDLEMDMNGIEPDAWTPESPDRANWLLQKLAAINEADAQDDETAKREIARIEMWQSREKEKRIANRRWYEKCLRFYMNQRYEKDGKQTISLPFGKLALKHPAWKLRVATAEEAAQLWNEPVNAVAVLEHISPNFVRVKVEPALSEIKKLIVKPEMGVGIKPAVIVETGEEIPGLVVEIPNEMTFTINVEKE